MRFLQEVLRWNPQLGLVSRRAPEAACERLLLESLELHRLIAAEPPGSPLRIVDVGSGAGFPGLVLGIVEPGWRLLLIERSARRAGFLEATIRIVGSQNIEVFAGPMEEASGPQWRGKTDVVTALAVGAPDHVGPLVEPFLAPGGRYVTTHAREMRLPRHIGATLRLLRSTPGQYGLYAEYERNV